MRLIAHLDMDAFFAAIEERDNPRFRGLPLVVGADPQQGRGRGVVATANYKAREYGIHSAMPISKAWQLSQTAKRQGKPTVIFIPPNFERYVKISQEIFLILKKYAALVEPASIDEFYLDLSFATSYEKAKKICARIKREVKKSQRLTCSIGLGPNKLIAKIASDKQKPDGLTLVTKKETEEFLEELPIRKIPGIGPKTEAMFKKMMVVNVKNLKQFSEARLHQLLGQWGLDLYEKVRGIDDSPVIEQYQTKSIGEQETFDKDTKDPNFIFERLDKMVKNIIEHLEQGGFKTFQTITIAVRFADFETKTHSHTLKNPTNSLNTLKFEAIKLLLPFFDKRQNPRGKLIRLIGLRVEKLS